MAETIHSLSALTDDDLLSIAAYLKSTKPTAEPEKKYPLYEGAQARGGQAYLDNCASCHGLDGKGIPNIIPALAGNGAVTAGGPQNVIKVVLGGLTATSTYAPMLAIGSGMTDQEVADVADYVRQAWGNTAPPSAEAGMVGNLRKDTNTPMNPVDANGCAVLPDNIARTINAPQSGIVSGIAAFTGDNPWVRAQQLAARAERLLPAANRAERVNALTSLYCRSLQANPKLDRAARSLELGHFAQLVYVASKNDAPHVAAAR
jgi:mono/diheme cytochrome c family protein